MEELTLFHEKSAHRLEVYLNRLLWNIVALKISPGRNVARGAKGIPLPKRQSGTPDVTWLDVAAFDSISTSGGFSHHADNLADSVLFASSNMHNSGFRRAHPGRERASNKITNTVRTFFPETWLWDLIDIE